MLKEAWNSTLYYGRIVFTSLADLLRGRESINNLSGPVGIVTAIGQAASYGWQDLLELLALITVNLGILNLLPFPALDGGKVVFWSLKASPAMLCRKSCKACSPLQPLGCCSG